MANPNDKSSHTKTYIVVMLITFLLGIALYFLSHAQIDKSWQTALEGIDDKIILEKIKHYDEAKESAWVWSIVSEFGIFISASVAVHLLYFFFIKREELQSIHSLKAQFRDETAKAIEAVVHGIHKWGLVAFRDKMDFSALFDELAEDDEMLWLDTYCPHIYSASVSIQNALSRGARIKFLFMDPGNEAVHWRAQEIADRYYANEENFRSDVKRFLQFLDTYSQASNGGGSLVYRTYIDLPGTPIYILRKKKDGAVKVYTSFYLNTPSADFVHIEWTNSAEESGLAKAFLTYFDEKWERCANSGFPNLEGKWSYRMQAEDIKNWEGSGICTVAQVGRTLIFKGDITAISGAEISPIPWASVWARICEPDGFIRIDYTISSSLSKGDYPAFCRLEIAEKQNNMNVLRMQGWYFLLENNNPNDPSAQSRYGSILFERLEE